MRLKNIFFGLLFWQIVLIIVSGLAVHDVPLIPEYLGGGLNQFTASPLLYSRGNFDGNTYVQIAKQGYSYGQEAFFPLYPNLIMFLDNFVQNPYWAGLIISVLSLLIAVIFFWKLLVIDYIKPIAYWTIVSLLASPASFFLTSIYTESLFLMLVLGAFYFARQKKWLVTGIMGALATSASMMGILLLPALLIEWWGTYNYKLKSMPAILSLVALLLIPIGLICFMLYLQKITGDPLAFAHTGDRIVMLYQVFWRYTRMILTMNKQTLLYPVVLVEGAIGLLFLVLTVFSFIKLRLSYAVFALSIYLASTFSGSFISLPRNVLICFPGFIILGFNLHKNAKLRVLYLGVCFLALIVMLSLFTTGHWVA